ncbi:SMP-30/gluconolactonase/LRE family protein [Saccharopolyspora sp. NFXS83]|uniref:SMP-30/gluconolactonase/LRE family protein n=1 Tax=Saccharopolyspora sp. NFXS83 TaxID=2993560 RepID=UPI00224AEB15|nr:SMP-30/gluconolactonase/LRE family protein [Saccharopolyspora sp. NFXS83]MCX2733840.1 SMP-30/gluconolactonase/LRE family protein [Saccharopolyspora sp. NFXS83]
MGVRRYRAEQITEACAEHGEGPVWHEGWPGLRWVDMLAGDVLTLLPGGTVRRAHVGSVAAALRPRAGGGAVLAVERGFALAEDDLADVRPCGELWADPGVRMNEGGCDPHGRFYCGSMAYAATPGAGRLYRLDASGHAEVVLDGVTISNGLAWSPDGAGAYYVDTPTQCVDAFAYRDGELTDRRRLVRIDPALGAPDGLAVDAEGCVWVALWGGAAVHRYAPDGGLLAVVELPVPRVTACTFGGSDLADLYITTSRQETDLRRHPEAGALFVLRDAGRGLPVLPYATT